MKYLVDTDRVVDYLKGKPEAVERMGRLQVDGLGISIVTYGEVYEGIYFGDEPRVFDEVFKRFLKGIEVMPLDKPVMRKFARLRGRLRGEGMLIPDPDLLIAATALQHELILVTGNDAHFKRIPGLRRLNP